MNPYENCPTFTTKNFTIRLINKDDSVNLFECYHDKTSVEFMNDDNCDFGFYVDTLDNMATTVKYWIEFYEKQYFIRFSIIDNETNKAIGTIEGFNGDIGVLRIDIKSEYEKAIYLSQLLNIAKETFYELFGNQSLVIKAIPTAIERRLALEKSDWKYINLYKGYEHYYQVETTKQA